MSSGSGSGGGGTAGGSGSKSNVTAVAPIVNSNNSSHASPGGNSADMRQQVLTRKQLQELVKQVDPNEQLDEDVEDVLLNYADDFMQDLIEGACTLAAHRKSNVVECKDVQTHLERSLNVWLPGFGTDELRPYKRAPVTEAHKQRMALIKKTLKNASDDDEGGDENEPVSQIDERSSGGTLLDIIIDDWNAGQEGYNV